MTRNDRKRFITRALSNCETIFFTLENEWGKTIGALSNTLDSKGMGSLLLGGEILETVGENYNDCLTLTMWYGLVEGRWEPFCAVIDFCGYLTGTYYDAI